MDSNKNDHTKINLEELRKLKKEFNDNNETNAQVIIAESRYALSEGIIRKCTRDSGKFARSFTDKVDGFVCNRFFGPVVLVLTLFAVYWLSIVQGYELTNYWWKVLAWIQDGVNSILPNEGFLADPFITSFVGWILQGVMAVLNYIPIFVILFALIAIMEDSGYMARIAFILDRVFRPFGLHGQSALPLMLGGFYVGGCAIPGIMATRAIKDEKARLATVLVIPLMNCLAKIPFYVLLIDIFFFDHSPLVMFMISTITIFMALTISKILSLTILKNKPTAPFIMEMPVYHLPTFGNVMRRVVERTWMFIKKVVTVIIFVMAVLYFLLNFPGLGQDKKIELSGRADSAMIEFISATGIENPYLRYFDTPEKIAEYLAFNADYRKAFNAAKDEKELSSVNEKFIMENPEFFKVAVKGSFTIDKTNLDYFPGYSDDYWNAFEMLTVDLTGKDHYQSEVMKNMFYSSWEKANPLLFRIARTGIQSVSGDVIKDSDAKILSNAIKTLERERKALRLDSHDTTLNGSFMGQLGVFVEPFTKYAGFDWRINVGLISAFAAKENTVSTLGSIYKSSTNDSDESQELSERIKEQNTGWTPLHAAAMILFMAFYPPCIATLVTLFTQAGFKWMLFALCYPIVLGFSVAVLVFSGGSLLGFSGLQSFVAFYFIMIIITVILGFVKPRTRKIKMQL